MEDGFALYPEGIYSPLIFSVASQRRDADVRIR